MVLQSSQGLPELLFYTKKSHKILQLQLQFQLQLQLQFYKGTHTTYKLHAASTSTRAHPENSPSRNPILHAEDKELFEYYYYTPDSRNSTHRRQGDLLEMHPCVLQDLPVTFQASSHKSLQRQLQLLQLLQRHSSLSRHSRHSSLSSLSRHSSRSRHSRDIPDIPVIHDLPAFPGNSSNSTLFQVSPGIPPHSSILRLECIFYKFLQILQFDWFPQKLHRVPVEQLQTLLQTLQTLHSSKKGRCCDIGQNVHR